MKALSTFLVVCVSATACAAMVSPTLPEPEWPDREAATNAALPVATWQKHGHFDVQMSVAAGTNLVQLAFGHDADGDGELSRAETALVVGRGFGEAFVEDVNARHRYAEELPSKREAPVRRGAAVEDRSARTRMVCLPARGRRADWTDCHERGGRRRVHRMAARTARVELRPVVGHGARRVGGTRRRRRARAGGDRSRRDAVRVSVGRCAEG